MALPGSRRTSCMMVVVSSFTLWLMGLEAGPADSPNAFNNTASLALFNTDIHLENTRHI